MNVSIYHIIQPGVQ